MYKQKVHPKHEEIGTSYKIIIPFIIHTQLIQLYVKQSYIKIKLLEYQSLL